MEEGADPLSCLVEWGSGVPLAPTGSHTVQDEQPDGPAAAAAAAAAAAVAAAAPSPFDALPAYGPGLSGSGNEQLLLQQQQQQQQQLAALLAPLQVQQQGGAFTEEMMDYSCGPVSTFVRYVSRQGSRVGMRTHFPHAYF